MRYPFALMALFIPSLAFAQTAEIEAQIQEHLAKMKWISAQFDDKTNGYRVDTKSKPSLRATSGAVRAIKTRGHLAQHGKIRDFVLTCYDPKTGSFAEPGGKPDVTITSVGVMVALELGVTREQIAKSMDYLKENAKSFEDVRIAAAAVEAWGVKDCPFDLKPWIHLAVEAGDNALPAAGSLVKKSTEPDSGVARQWGSLVALILRLDQPMPKKFEPHALEILQSGQRADGGWAKKGEKVSDLETTYRVMRAFYLMKEKPSDLAALKEFLKKCRNADGGYGVSPGDPSSMSGVYYTSIIQSWINKMEKK